MDKPGSEAQIVYQRLFSLDAPGSTGKTLATTAIQCYLKPKEKRVLAVPIFNVAAQLSDGGRTDHSANKIPFSINSKSTCNIEADSPLAHKLCGAHLVL